MTRQEEALKLFQKLRVVKIGRVWYFIAGPYPTAAGAHKAREEWDAAPGQVGHPMKFDTGKR
jgi:hypothetical protein